MTGLAWGIAALAIFYGIVVTIGGIRLVWRVEALITQRNEARRAGAEQAVEAQEQANAVQEACRIMRAQLESQATDEGWEEVGAFLTEHEG